MVTEIIVRFVENLKNNIMKTIKKLFSSKKEPKDCNHKSAYFFHDNAPMYCPKCNSYIDGGRVVCSGK